MKNKKRNEINNLWSDCNGAEAILLCIDPRLDAILYL